jgi:hypothetical protein
MANESQSLIKISQAEQALQEAADIHDIIDLRDKAMAYQILADAKGFAEAAQKAKIFQLKAERKAGDWLIKNVDHKGNRFGTEYQDGTPLPEGIDKHESSRWQLEAKLPEAKFNEWIDYSILRDREISASGLQHEAKKHLGIQTYKFNPNPTPVEFGFWVMPRPLTHSWGSGHVWKRICEEIGTPDVAFGETDGIPDGILGVDRKTGYEWAKLPFADNQFAFGYWDPPYDSLYKKEGQEIWRTCRKLAILHTFIYPRAWFKDAGRAGMIAVTMGPLKQIRCLQIFIKVK